jgi:hypothetical protein
MNWNVIVTYPLNKVFGYQSANKHRDNLIVLASRRAARFLGGSRTLPNDLATDLYGGPPRSKSAGLGPSNVIDYVDVEIDGTNQVGITYQARVECRVDRVGLSITPKIRNVTDGTDAIAGAACAAVALDYSGTNQKQTLVFVPAAGVKKYRLMFTLNNVGGSHWLTGEIESFATA